MIQAYLDWLQLEAWQLEELYHPKQQILEFETASEFLKSSDKVMICGDYDADGITSTTILVLLLQSLKKSYGYYIPNRMTEGYGASAHIIEQAHQKGYTDVIMVDNGVKAKEAIEKARTLGMRVLVIDHHLYDVDLPWDVLVHTDHCIPYGNHMCAAGLAFSIAEYMGLETDEMLSLACLGTIADVMPLWGKNREIVKRGLEVLNKNAMPHFDAIIKRTRFTRYSVQSLAFQVIPKINTIGRLGDKINVNTAVQFFLTKDPSQIDAYVAQMLKWNQYRKDKGSEFVTLAQSLLTDDLFQICVDPSFHEGMVGIVANKIAQETQKPTLILTEYETVYKGSARSHTISLKTLFDGLNPDYFVGMGGHDFAYGMTIKRERFAEFEKDVQTAMQDAKPSEAKKEFEYHLPFEAIDHTLKDALLRLEPFGEGFPMPSFNTTLPSHMQVSRLGAFGYKMMFSQGDVKEAVYFTNQSWDASQTEARVSINCDDRFKLSIMIEDCWSS